MIDVRFIVNVRLPIRIYLAGVNDVVLLHAGGEQEGPHRQEPADQHQVEQGWEEREDERAGDLSDCLAGLSYHVCGN